MQRLHKEAEWSIQGDLNMEISGFFGGFYKVGEWIIKLLYVNLLWILFTVVGLGVLGIMPSTVALFSVIRKWLKNEEVPVFSSYWSYFKKEFKRSNLVGLILAIIGFILYWDYYILLDVSGTIFQALSIVFIFLFIIAAIMLLYLFPVMAEYDFKVLSYFKHTLLFSFVSPLATIVMIVGLFITFILMLMVPGLIALFGASSVAFILMSSANIAFSKAKNLGTKEEETQ